MRPFSEVLSAKPGVSLVKTAKYTEGSDTRNPYLAVLQGWIFPGFMPLPGIFGLAFLPHAYLRATKGDFSLWIYTIIQVADFCKRICGYFFVFISTEMFYVI